MDSWSNDQVDVSNLVGGALQELTIALEHEAQRQS